MPDMKGAKANQHDERQQEKRIEDLENLYSLLPDVEPDTVEVHYEQFDQNAQKTYNYLSNGLHLTGGINRGSNIIAIMPTTVDEDVALNDLILGGQMMQQPQVRSTGNVDPAQLEIIASDLPPEEKLMINQALKDEKDKRKKKSVEKAKKKGWCGCFA
jgi:hypothetical protein